MRKVLVNKLITLHGVVGRNEWACNVSLCLLEHWAKGLSLFGDREVWDNAVNQPIVLHGGGTVPREVIPGGEDVK